MKKLTLIILIISIIFAVILNFLPHLNYQYPLHVDEWVHFQYANHLSSSSPLYFGQEYKSLEAGFHYLLATLNSIGIPYLFMFTFFASLITILICLGVFIYTRRLFGETAALFSVLFIALLKSTAMILGPVFFVPMAIGMFFIAIGLFLIKLNSKLIIPILASILIIHPPTAMAFLLLINTEFLILAITKKQNYLKNLLNQAIAGAIALPFYLDIFLSKGLGTVDYLSFTIISSALFIPRFLTWMIVIIAVIGIYFSAEKKGYSVAVYVIALLIFIFTFYYFKIEVFIPYRRALMYLFLILAIPFGFGCDRIISLTKNKKIQILIGIILIALILFFALPSKLNENKQIYHIINDKEFEAFNYTKENTDKTSIAVLDPWKANALTPLAERQVYSRIVQGPNEEIEKKNKKIEEFFNNNCTDIEFLKQNNISIVYGECESEFLSEIHKNVWIVNKVSRVIDGDTFKIGDISVRLICIDAPELESGGEGAKNFLESLILNKIVRLEKDVSETDKYNRLLRYAYVDDVFVNKEIVDKGYASVFPYGNDTKRCEEIAT